MTILKILLVTAFMVLIPCAFGAFITGKAGRQKEEDSHTIFVMLISGLAAMLALFEVLSIPCILAGIPYDVFCYGMAAVMGTAALVLLILKRIHVWRAVSAFFRELPGWGAAAFAVLLLVGIQVFVVVWFQADGNWDPAAAAAQTSLKTNAMFRYDTYTGQPLASVPFSELIFPLALFYGMLSKLTGLTPAFLTNTLLPVFWIFYAYAVQLLFAAVLFDKDRKKEMLYLFFACMLVIFGYYSGRSLSMRFLQSASSRESVAFCVLLPAAAAYGLGVVKRHAAGKSGETGKTAIFGNTAKMGKTAKTVKTAKEAKEAKAEKTAKTVKTAKVAKAAKAEKTAKAAKTEKFTKPEKRDRR